MSIRHAYSVRSALPAILIATAACGSATNGGDSPKPIELTPQGAGPHIRDISDPTAPTHVAHGTSGVLVRGAIVNAVDTFDETHDGKSRGTIYVQDDGEPKPYSGISLYRPIFVPANLRPAPGDVFDFFGTYQENSKIGTAEFTNGGVLTQLFEASATFRFEKPVPAPIEVSANDFVSFATGRKWVGMLVTVKNASIVADFFIDSKGRKSAAFVKTADIKNSPAITNELFDLDPANYPTGTQFKSITGIVTYFFNLHIAPRSAADLVK